MATDRRVVDKGMVRPRLEVLRRGLQQLSEGDTDACGTVRRMASVLLSWAREEGLTNVEDAAFRLEVGPDRDLRATGQALVKLLDHLLESEEASVTGPLDLVLAVEDNPTDAAFIETTLTTPERTLRIVSTVSDAEEVIGRTPVDLLILDLMLPDTDGRGLLLRLREQERHRDLPILVLSGKSSTETKTECLALGANAFFEKPLDPSELKAAVSSYLYRARQRRLELRRDPVTGFFDRSHFRESWSKRSFRDPTSIALLGLDRFRSVRDTFGDEASNAVLRFVADLLRDVLPRTCLFSRWSASEFLILVPGLDERGTIALLEHVMTRLREAEHPAPSGGEFRITASGGVVGLRPGASMDRTVLEVEGRLAWAAAAGGNVLADRTAPAESISVMIAEDDPLTASIVQHELEKEGFEVLHYPDGLKALDGAMSHRVSLAILDVKMPEMDGFELLDRLRSVPTYHDLPIMMLTSMGREEDIVRGFSLGADDYMLKPFSPVEVVARARRLLRR